MILGIDVGQKNIGVCVWDGTNIRKWAVWNSAGSWAPDIFQCVQTNATPEFLEGVTRVVIERQPSKNPSMTRIMHYLEFYFVSQGLQVCIQDSKHKLLFATTTPWFPHPADTEWTYHRRKKLAVQTISTFVERTAQPLRDVFETSKKKDDLADALLHAMAYEKFFAAIPENKTKTKKIVARAPTEKQRRTGKLSASNVKYLLQSADDVPALLKKDRQLARALKKHFGNYETYKSSIQHSYK